MNSIEYIYYSNNAQNYFSEPKSNNSSKALNSFTSSIFGSYRWVNHLFNVINIIFPMHWEAAIERLFSFLNEHACDYEFVGVFKFEKTMHGFFTNFIDPEWNLFFIPHHSLQHWFTSRLNTWVYFFRRPSRIIITFFCHFYNFKF